MVIKKQSLQLNEKPPLCKGRWHFRKKMTEGLCVSKLSYYNPSVACGASSLYTREAFRLTANFVSLQP